MMEKFNLDIPRIGYIILFKNKGNFIGRQIKKVQLKNRFKEEDAEYIHCAISCGGSYIMDINPPKAKVLDMCKRYKRRYIKILHYINEDYERKGRYKVALWSVSQSNLRYDWFGALALKFKLFWQWGNRPFCAENILWALQKEYVECLAGIKPENCMPAHFLDERYFELVWSGIID